MNGGCARREAGYYAAARPRFRDASGWTLLDSLVSAAYVSNEDLKVKVKYARPALEERQAAERALMPGDPNRLTWRMCNPGGS